MGEYKHLPRYQTTGLVKQVNAVIIEIVSVEKNLLEATLTDIDTVQYSIFYLNGEKLVLEPKEEAVFINMSKAFKVYDKVVENLELDQISELDDLIKLIRNDLQRKP